MTILIKTLSMLLLSPSAFADFGEIDIVVRESVEIHFKEYSLAVDTSRLEYRGSPRIEGDRLVVRSSVWAEQRVIAPYWGWHECTTKIEIKAPGIYADRGSNCSFDFD